VWSATAVGDLATVLTAESAVRTIFRLTDRPHRNRAGGPPAQKAVLENSQYGLTWFKVAFALLPCKAYAKGEHILCFEATVHNTRELPCRRRPVELGQRLATLDLLSSGRLIAGISVGWSDDEHQQMGVDPRTRGRRCGEFFSIPESVVRPKPLQQPRPRLMSGMRSAVGLARTAQLFDIWNPSRGSAQEIAETLSCDAGSPPGRCSNAASLPACVPGTVSAGSAARAQRHFRSDRRDRMRGWFRFSDRRSEFLARDL
jgi:Luciferase-like monooxygenase